MSRPLRVRGALAVLSLLAVAAGVPAQVRADTRSDLASARSRLQALAAKIGSQEAVVAKAQAQMRDAASHLRGEEGTLIDIQRHVRATQVRLDSTRTTYEGLRARVGMRARSVYMRGPFDVVDLVLGSDSLRGLVERLMFAVHLIRRDTDAANQLGKVAFDLQGQEAQQNQLLKEQAAEVGRLRDERDRLQGLFAQEAAALASLASARAEVQSLIIQLQGKLRAEELAAARSVAGKGMPITFGQWAHAFLPALGAPSSRNNLVAVVAWETAEYTTATWNPLATTYPMPDSTVFNGDGVRNYTSEQHGVQASVLTLHQPGHGYDAIVAALNASADPLDTARAINASDWCRGCSNGNYVVELVQAVDAYYDHYANA